MSKNPLRGEGKLTGLVPVLPTPLNEDESLDEEGFEKLADFVCQYPFSGVWALASAGEDQNLPYPVIDQAAALFVKSFAGRIPVLVKTSSPGLKETIERTKRMADFGFDAATIHLEHKLLGRDHARRFFIDVAEASPLPIYIYHNANRGAQLDVDLLIELTGHPNVAGMKAGGSNLSELQRLCLLSDPDVSVMTAGGGQILAGLAMGASAHTAIPLLAFPERAFRLLEHLRGGRLEEARSEQRIILQFIDQMPKLRNREITAEVKAVLELRNVIKRAVSAPFVAVSDAQMDSLQYSVAALSISS